MLVITGSASTQATSPAASAASSAAQVVELDHHRVFGQVVHLAEQAVALHRLAVDQIDEHVFDGAVVAAVEHQDLAPPGGGADPAHDVAVGVGRAHGELPHGRPKRSREQGADGGRVARGEHGREAARRLR